MRKNYKWFLLTINLLIYTMVILMSGGKISVYAKPAVGELQVQLPDLKTYKSEKKNVEVRIYRVGNVTDEGIPKLDTGYVLQEYPKDNDSLEKTAKKLAGMVMEEPVRIGKTDENGYVRFEEINQGVYLVVVPEKNHYGKVTPFLVPMPYYIEVDGVVQEPEFIVKAEPKASPEGEQPERGGLAKTGDKADVSILLLVAVVSLGCMILIIDYRRRKE